MGEGEIKYTKCSGLMLIWDFSITLHRGLSVHPSHPQLDMDKHGWAGCGLFALG